MKRHNVYWRKTYWKVLRAFSKRNIVWQKTFGERLGNGGWGLNGCFKTCVPQDNKKKSNLILSSWPLSASMDLLNSSEMSNLWASNNKRIRSTRSANHSYNSNSKSWHVYIKNTFLELWKIQFKRSTNWSCKKTFVKAKHIKLPVAKGVTSIHFASQAIGYSWHRFNECTF